MLFRSPRFPNRAGKASIRMLHIQNLGYMGLYVERAFRASYMGLYLEHAFRAGYTGLYVTAISQSRGKSKHPYVAHTKFRLHGALCRARFWRRLHGTLCRARFSRRLHGTLCNRDFPIAREKPAIFSRLHPSEIPKDYLNIYSS